MDALTAERGMRISDFFVETVLVVGSDRVYE